MSKPGHNILGTLHPADFLQNYWQKKPLLIHGAIPGFTSPLAAEELAGLACEEGVESRLVEFRNGAYLLDTGPFDAKRFSKLPKRDWTLLVQDVEKHLPELAAILDRFDFIPHWRIDDLMISYAVKGGSVGPHTDAYDVFLLQASGRRCWSIAEHYNPEIVPGMDVKVLKEFKAEQEWILEPGDMLYLPPDVAHEGVALDDECMTWSVGFRAPSLRDMFLDLSEWLYQRLPEDVMYADPDLAVTEAGRGEISAHAFTRMRALLRTAMNVDDGILDGWFGQFMTEPKPWLACETSENTPARDMFHSRLASGDALVRDTRALLAWRSSSAGTVLFVNGEAWDAGGDLEGLLELLCTQRRFSMPLLEPYLHETGLALLRRLHEHGALHFASMVETDNG